MLVCACVCLCVVRVPCFVFVEPRSAAHIYAQHTQYAHAHKRIWLVCNLHLLLNHCLQLGREPSSQAGGQAFAQTPFKASLKAHMQHLLQAAAEVLL